MQLTFKSYTNYNTGSSFSGLKGQHGSEVFPASFDWLIMICWDQSGSYHNNDHYVWQEGTRSQLLFIFPTAVTMTTITLHYYSDSDQGLPRLVFHVVSDDFDIWDGSITTYGSTEVAAVLPGEEPAGCRNVSTSVNFNTKKVLIGPCRSDFRFVVSEVEFFTCSNGKFNQCMITSESIFLQTNCHSTTHKHTNCIKCKSNNDAGAYTKYT